MPIGAFKLNSIGRYLAPTGRSAVALTVGSSISISTTRSKFGGSSILFANANTDIYGSVYPSAPITFGTGDFTVEFWIYPTGTNTTAGIITKRNYNNVADGTWGIYYNGSTRAISWQNIFSTGGVTTHTSSTSAFSLNAWSHWAFVRSGSTLTMYVNGTSVGSFSNSLNFNYQDQPIRIGDWDGSAGNGLAGNLDEIRISSVARYTAAFTAPSSSFVNDSNTLLLIHADGTNGSTSITDDATSTQRTALTLTANGNAQISTAQSKFGGASALFDGTGDYVDITANSGLNFGTGNYTVEAWVRFTNFSVIRPIYACYGTGQGFGLYAQTNASVNFYHDGVGQIASLSNVFVANTWYHVALVRNSGTTTIYVDGVSKASTSTSYNQTGVGANYYIGYDASTYMNGYIDELRISNTARYTAGFTAPTAALVNDSNTILLTHMNGANASTTFTDDNG